HFLRPSCPSRTRLSVDVWMWPGCTVGGQQGDGARAGLCGRGGTDRPANLGAPGRFVAGVLGADEEVLANRAIDGDRVLGDVGGQGAIGQVKVAIRAGVHHGGQFCGWYREFGEASGASEVTVEGDENGRLPSFAGD